MSPHGKLASGQARGQPRPPPSTPRAPDPRGCEPRAPGCPGAPLGATARGRAPPAPGGPRPAGRARKGPRRGARLPSLRAPRSPPCRLWRYTTAAAAALALHVAQRRPRPALGRGPGRDAASGRQEPRAAPRPSPGGPSGHLGNAAAWSPLPWATVVRVPGDACGAYTQTLPLTVRAPAGRGQAGARGGSYLGTTRGEERESQEVISVFLFHIFNAGQVAWEEEAAWAWGSRAAPGARGGKTRSCSAGRAEPGAAGGNSWLPGAGGGVRAASAPPRAARGQATAPLPPSAVAERRPGVAGGAALDNLKSRMRALAPLEASCASSGRPLGARAALALASSWPARVRNACSLLLFLPPPPPAKCG
nr:translation initiation factor IF-2-like [Oryctolagus cuniculus]XP_051687879.1 translation initiation factor IF-2-like [Oryctolagus cuniculus]XP_051687880.1 translation initiation factor IF-2-like [Oryctolagus cuniculus]